MDLEDKLIKYLKSVIKDKRKLAGLVIAIVISVIIFYGVFQLDSSEEDNKLPVFPGNKSQVCLEVESKLNNESFLPNFTCRCYPSQFYRDKIDAPKKLKESAEFEYIIFCRNNNSSEIKLYPVWLSNEKNETEIMK